MEKAKYVIVNSKSEYFVEISKLNKIVFTKDINEAAKIEYSDVEDLTPLIELYSGMVALAKQCK